MRRTKYSLLFRFSLVLIIISLLAGCNLPTYPAQSSTNPQITPISDIQQTMVTFRLTIPEPIPSGDSIYITLLDEVTGLSFNPHKYILNAEDSLHYSVSLPLYLGKVIKYRYSREGSTMVNEHLYNDRPVRYRLYHVEGPANVQDVLSCWTDSAYLGPKGRIMGQVLDFSTGKPIPNLLVAAGGEQALTLADGTFLLEGLPVGTHNLVFYSLDGSYDLYQQGAAVAADSTTPVSVQLSPAKLVTVIFTIKVPADTPPDAPIRLAGNLYQLGNTYADLLGGVSSLASRMPLLGKLSDGRYMVTLSLPADAYLEYKYTLGDGLWSSEVNDQGTFRLRQLIVPKTNLEENEVVDAWYTSSTSPIRFEVKVPLDTPQGETISIQFNPGFGWLESLPMWPATSTQGETVWRFDLTGPFNDQSSLYYRYCRQEQCGSADDSATMGLDPTGRELNPLLNPGVVRDEVVSWAWLTEQGTEANISGAQVTPRVEDFVAGVTLQANYHPSWGPLLQQAIQGVQSLGVNWLVLSPTWTFTNQTPPILEPQPAQDMLWPDLISVINLTQRAELNTGLFPTAHFPVQVDQWWQTAALDYPWWMSFYERYTNFILHHATIAAKINVNTLILGGEWLSPALPSGLLPDGSPSHVPQDAELRWRDLIAQVREKYNGTIAWALSFPDGVKNPPPFLDAVDQIYLLWSAPLSSQPGSSLEELQAQAGAILDQDVLPFQQQVGKPIILAISYPSIDRSATGCITILGGGCLDYSLLSPPNPDIAELTLDLQEQANAYTAVLSAINERSWVSGYVSMGYYPPAILLDKSTSIHGKPTSDVLWYWSCQFLGR
ncbi:MAG: hypothetical protein WAV05_18455 [Anaerolineales bacterium]